MSESAPQKTVLTQPLILLMAFITGVAVSNLYYIQPIQALVATTFHVTSGAVGTVAMLTQVGYALGLLLIVPFGDVMSRYQLILRMLGLSLLSLLAAYLAPNFIFFALTGLMIGLTSVVPQIIIPYAAVLAQPQKRGAVLGTILSGLLMGVLLSRSFSGIISSYIHWRWVYLIATIAIALLILLVALKLPKDSRPKNGPSYWQTISSIPGLIAHQRLLREAAINGFFMFGTLSIFWSTLVFYMASPAYRLGSGTVGLLAILGAAGALAAPIIGRLADAKSPRFIIATGLFMMTISYLLFLFWGHFMPILMLGIVLLDVGNQCGQVANQTRVKMLGEATSSRNNTVFMFAYFMGGASGSFFGALAWSFGGWVAVCLLALAYQCLALIAHFILYRPKSTG